jgi:hypothetical protein
MKRNKTLTVVASLVLGSLALVGCKSAETSGGGAASQPAQAACSCGSADCEVCGAEESACSCGSADCAECGA